MMLRKMMFRRRNIRALRMVMLRRRTNRKTGTHTLCEPVQSSHFMPEFSCKMRGPGSRRRLCASLRSRTK